MPSTAVASSSWAKAIDVMRNMRHFSRCDWWRERRPVGLRQGVTLGATSAGLVGRRHSATGLAAEHVRRQPRLLRGNVVKWPWRAIGNRRPLLSALEAIASESGLREIESGSDS